MWNLLLVSCIFLAVEAADLECTYRNYQKSGYTCAVISKTFKNDDSTIIFGGEHFAGHTDADVKYVAFCLSYVETPPSEIFENFPNVEQLNVEVARMKMIDRNSLRGAFRLEKLFARGNYLTKLEADTFSEATNLKLINFHDNSINSIDENAFRRLVRLEELYLGKNWINDLSNNTFNDLINLKAVYLQSNRIDHLTEGLFRNTLKLEKIVLANNKIKIIPEDSFKTLSHLKQISLILNVCAHNIFGRGYVPLAMLNGTVSNCTLANTLEEKNRQLTIEIEAFKLSAVKLEKNYEEYDERKSRLG